MFEEHPGLGPVPSWPPAVLKGRVPPGNSSELNGQPTLVETGRPVWWCWWGGGLRVGCASAPTGSCRPAQGKRSPGQPHQQLPPVSATATEADRGQHKTLSLLPDLCSAAPGGSLPVPTHPPAPRQSPTGPFRWKGSSSWALALGSLLLLLAPGHHTQLGGSPSAPALPSLWGCCCCCPAVGRGEVQAEPLSCHVASCCGWTLRGPGSARLKKALPAGGGIRGTGGCLRHSALGQALAPPPTWSHPSPPAQETGLVWTKSSGAPRPTPSS